MASTVLNFDGLESNFIDEKQVGLTVKLSPTQFGPTSYEDVFFALDKAGVKPTDILGLYKVSQNDFSYSLFLSNEEVLKNLVDKRVISVVSMYEQTVRLKIHWLPLFYENRLLKAIFCDFGEVSDVQMCKSSYANVCAMNGQRELLLKTDEVSNQKIPHLVKLGSGQSLLVTMQGRLPLCLKCHDVGHTCKNCPMNRRSFAGVTAHGNPTGPRAAEPPAGANSGPVGMENASPPGDSAADGSDASTATSGDQEPFRVRFVNKFKYFKSNDIPS